MQRYLRWGARRNLAIKTKTPMRPQRLSLMRPGYAPGYPKKRPGNEVEELLAEVHGLAFESFSPPKNPPWAA